MSSSSETHKTKEEKGGIGQSKGGEKWKERKMESGGEEEKLRKEKGEGRGGEGRGGGAGLGAEVPDRFIPGFHQPLCDSE